MKFDGTSETVEVFIGGLVLTRRGIARLSKKSKIIDFADITGVKFQAASVLRKGYIRFIVGDRSSIGGLFSAAGDEDSVLFSKKQQPYFRYLSDLVEYQIQTGSFRNQDIARIDNGPKAAFLQATNSDGSRRRLRTKTVIVLACAATSVFFLLPGKPIERNRTAPTGRFLLTVQFKTPACKDGATLFNAIEAIRADDRLNFTAQGCDVLEPGTEVELMDHSFWQHTTNVRYKKYGLWHEGIVIAEAVR